MISEDLTLVSHAYRRYRLCVLFMLFFLIATLAMFFIMRPLVFVMLAIAVVFHLFVLRPNQKAYTNAYSNANLKLTVCKKLGTDKILEKAHQNITEETLEQARLMPVHSEKGGAPLFRWEVSGTIKGVPVTLCDATIPQSFKLAAKGKPRVHFDAGVWAHITLPSDSGLHFRVLEETSVPTPIRMEYFANSISYENAPLEDEDLKSHCVLYRPKGTDQQPSYSFCKSLKSLMKYTPGYVAVSVHGSSMDVFIRGRFLTRALSLTEKPTEKTISFDPFPELSYLVDLARSVS